MALLTLGPWVGGPARAGLITFEPDGAGNLPDGSLAIDDLPVDAQFLSQGVRFGIDDDLDGLPDAASTPFLERTGQILSSPEGFLNDTLGLLDIAATPALGLQLGDWFLRTTSPDITLLITYPTTLTAAASGEIWDIDGNMNNQGMEAWVVQALDSSHTVIDSIASPIGNNLSLDGRPWIFSFSHGISDIRAIRIEYAGTKPNPGVAFNNFLPVPEPSTLLLTLSALAGVALLSRRRSPALRALVAIGISIPLLAGPRMAMAVSVNGLFVDDLATCDNPGNQVLRHELGDVAAGGFPISEGLAVTVQPTQQVVCVGDDGLQNDWLVEIRNLSSLAYTNLYFVADAGLAVGNVDGSVSDLSVVGSPSGQAFRIDGTVTLGMNDNLLSEDATLDEIFSPGETWMFLVSNFGAAAAPLFASVGVFAGTSAPIPGSNASILATVVPEPSTLLLLLLGLAGLALLARRGAWRARTLGMLLLSALWTAGPQTASAVSVNGLFVDDPVLCDNPGGLNLRHELGPVTPGGGGFPIVEGLAVSTQSTLQVACVQDAGLNNSWLVDMTNLSNVAYENLYFVADALSSGFGYTLGNSDGTVVDLSNAAVPPGNAFRIDGTVTGGINNNLVFESGTVDEIFSPGETWQFLVTNFGAPGAPLFGSVGVFGGTSGSASGSNASILATVVPEPSTLPLLLCGLAALALLARRRERGLLEWGVVLLSIPLLCGPRIAWAVPVNGQFKDNLALCDNPGDQVLRHELGLVSGGFPISEGLEVFVLPTTQVVCVADDGIQNDWLIEIHSLSNIAYKDLFFVADATPGAAITVGNKDGTVVDLNNVASPDGEAFRIDGTATFGLNDNLIFESGAPDEILSPGEIWRFLLTNFGTQTPPLFGSAGVFAGTSGSAPGSNASILATAVPEPSTLVLAALGLAGVAGLGRRRRGPAR